MKNIDFEFSSGVNLISGSNGTCKTSLLHMISNSFQAPTRNDSWIQDKKCLPVINHLNYLSNPKIETLNRGDTKYNDPAIGVNGVLFTTEYYNGTILGFRRHNTTIPTGNRYAIKPKYARGSSDKLPSLPVIYLGLSRLLPFGEFQDDSRIIKISKKLPQQYQSEFAELYKYFTHYDISSISSLEMGDIKRRNSFVSDCDGVDSNTISAGEDNVSIILTALLSLKYYFNSISSTRNVESILLIDELDATLHPSYQFKMLKLFERMARDYKIQIIFTTHSLTLIEDALKKNVNVIYLIDNIKNVIKLENPDIQKIKLHLFNISTAELYSNAFIPLFSEDDEARVFIELLFDYYQQVNTSFRSIRSCFHLVKACLGADSLEAIFKDFRLSEIRDRSICIVDGDHPTDIKNLIISLPGDNSPEEMIYMYLKDLYSNDDNFWQHDQIIRNGYSKQWYLDNISSRIDEFKTKLEEKRQRGESTKGETREFNKKLFNDHINFFKFVILHWINNANNASAIKDFFEYLKVAFRRVSIFYQLNPNEWAD